MRRQRAGAPFDVGPTHPENFPVAAQGEPIGFVRSIDYGSGKRYYALGEEPIAQPHRFDETFDQLARRRRS